MSIEITPAFEKAIDLMENTDKNVFITGKAGTGKSTLLRYFRSHTKKNIVVLAPTGVASVNINGQTIHSFFKFGPTTTVETVRRFRGDPSKNIYQKIQAIIIDEISMVRADLLDCVDRAMRLNGKNPRLPFGGAQLIFFGDLYQLPPVVPAAEEHIFEDYYDSPFFFSAKSFQNLPLETIELTKIYRQSDQRFINLLNAIRNDKCSPQDLSHINQQVDYQFRMTPDSPYIYLTTRNMTATQMNTEMLHKINQPIHTFNADVKGTFGKELYPAPSVLQLKAGARVMMVYNDVNKKWVNGTMATVTRIEPNGGQSDIYVRLDNGAEHRVKPNTWEISKFVLDDNRITSATMGEFKQYPMILAWAMTIHKSQGNTFDKIAVDLDRGAFSAGQVYVALSRCTTLEGIVLTKPINEKSIWVDRAIAAFMSA